MKINFVTKNQFKINTAIGVLRPPHFEIVPIELNLDEIQADNNFLIAKDTAIKAFEILKEPIIREDHGLYIEALNGFPGPYTAYIEKTLDPKYLIRMLEGESRKAYYKMSLVYVDSKQCINLESRVPLEIAKSLGSGISDFNWEALMVVNGKPLSEYKHEDRYPLFNENFRKLLNILK